MATTASTPPTREQIMVRLRRAEGQLRGVNPLMEIAVKGSNKARVVEATDALAARVVDRVSVYVAEKTALLKQQVASSAAQLAAVNDRIDVAQQQQAEILADRTLPLDQRLLVSSNLNSVITTSDARRASIQDDLSEARQLLNLAQNVESSSVVEMAAASKTTARSSRTSLIVGALVGLLLGAIAALVAGTLAGKREPAASGG